MWHRTPRQLLSMYHGRVPSHLLLPKWSAFYLDFFKNEPQCGFGSFSVASPALWNAIPDDVKSANNVMTFHCQLKTYLFKLAYHPSDPLVDDLEFETDLNLPNDFGMTHHCAWVSWEFWLHRRLCMYYYYYFYYSYFYYYYYYYPLTETSSSPMSYRRASCLQPSDTWPSVTPCHSWRGTRPTRQTNYSCWQTSWQSSTASFTPSSVNYRWAKKL